VGDAFNSAGLVVRATYSDSSTENITGYTLSWDGAALAENSTAITAAAGTRTVTVTYQGKTANFNITVSALQYIVTFHPNGGSPTPVPQTVTAGGTASAPAAITRPQGGLFQGAVNVGSLNISFGNWHTQGSSSPWDFSAPVTGNLDLYAGWTEPAGSIDISGESGDNIVVKALAYLRKQTLSVTTNYTIVVDGDSEDYKMLDNSYTQQDPPNITTANAVITLTGKVPTEIRPGSYGSIFCISAGTLILDNNITLKGGASAVYLDGPSASLTMKAGAKISGSSSGGVRIAAGSFAMEGGEISGNTTSGGGGGVYVTGGSFTMTDGKISGTRADYGGGVYGAFTMNGGEISGNTATSVADGGGGVYVTGGSFTMNAGEISSNSGTYSGGVFVNDHSSFVMEGGKISGNSGNGLYVAFHSSFTMKTGAKISGGDIGVYIYDSSFAMEGGEISGNSLGGVLLHESSSFTMSDGTISGNSASGFSGGGVFVFESSFTMSGGTISGNTASEGGGVCVGKGSFTMNGGTISGNSASDSGGGVYVAPNGSFSKTKGVIYGDTDGTHTPGSTENTARAGNTYGHAVFYYYGSSASYYRDTTLDTGDNLSTGNTGSGWNQ
jgi:hypothetical protein